MQNLTDLQLSNQAKIARIIERQPNWSSLEVIFQDDIIHNGHNAGREMFLNLDGTLFVISEGSYNLHTSFIDDDGKCLKNFLKDAKSELVNAGLDYSNGVAKNSEYLIIAENNLKYHAKRFGDLSRLDNLFKCNESAGF